MDTLKEDNNTFNGKRIVFKPNEGPQTDFLAATEMEVLYGGPLTLDTKVLTPTGYVALKYINIGDYVYNRFGKKVKVIDIPFIGDELCFELTFKDGSKVKASAGHKWLCGSADYRKTTKPLRKLITKDLIAGYHYVPLSDPVQFDKKDLPLDPYFVGCMLGDGCLTKRCNMTLTGIDMEIVDFFNLPEGYSAKRSKGTIQWKFTRGQIGGSKIRNSIIWDSFCSLGLEGVRSHTKFIPDIYKFSSVEDRIALLQGLMDTDGCVRVRSKKGGREIKFTTISERLKDDFVFLATSLGFRTNVCVEEASSLTYRVYLFASDICPFRLTRKVDIWKQGVSGYKTNYIVDVKKLYKTRVKCITVDSKDHTFLLSNCIVTMNSAGGGKSMGMLMDPLRYFGNGRFRGLLLRRTTEELRELVQVSQEIYPQIINGIKWSQQKMQWTGPSGATLWLSYLDRDQDVTRYQGQSYCVSVGTPVLMADGTYKNIEDIKPLDNVKTLEGSQKVLAVSEKYKTPCVKVTTFSSEGHQLGEQLHPYTHPIALLSSKPYLTLPDLCHNVEQFRLCPLQWRSYKYLVYENQGSLENVFSLKDEKTDCARSVQSTQDQERHNTLFYPTVLFSPSLQLNLSHASILYYAFYKFLQQWYETCQDFLKTQYDPQQPYELLQWLVGYKTELFRQFYDDVLNAQPEMETIVGSLTYYQLYRGLCDVSLLQALATDLSASHIQDDVGVLNLLHFLCNEKGCIQEYSRYESLMYSHPYTQEQRLLKVPLELGIVRAEPLDESPYVIDICVNSSNNYITKSGIVNQNCWIGFDELTQWPTQYPWDYLRSRLRTTDPDLDLCMRATTNSGGVGHLWVKRMFIDPAPPNTSFWATDEKGETLVYPPGHAKEGKPLFKRKFIPARLHDNPYLARDGMYEANLLSLPEHERRRLLYGDWDILEGNAFPEWRRDHHVCEPFNIPKGWIKFRACDYGYGSKTAVLWFAISPWNQLFVYRELYVSGVTAADLAYMILDIEADDGKIKYGVLDSSMWHQRGDGGPSMAEQMIRRGCRWRPSDRSKGSRLSGKNEVHRKLQVDPETEEAGLVFFNTCVESIAQIPTLPLDPDNPEDVDTDAEDHIYDALRYGLMTRPSAGTFDFTTGMGIPTRQTYIPADSTFGY